MICTEVHRSKELDKTTLKAYTGCEVLAYIGQRGDPDHHSQQPGTATERRATHKSARPCSGARCYHSRPQQQLQLHHTV